MFALLCLLSVHPPSAYAGTAAHTVTAYGNAQITTAQWKFGGASGLFHGSGDYLSAPDSNDWYFGSGDFTIDFWVRFNVLPTGGTIYAIVSQYQSGATGWHIEALNGVWRFEVWGAAVSQFYFASSVQSWSTGVWYHVALVRSGNTWYWFQSGSQIGTTTNAVSVMDMAAPLWIGENEQFTGRFFNGWLDEFRVSKGIARWTGGFIPPSSAYTAGPADPITVLLLHMDGTNGSTMFTDDSANIPPGPTSFSFNVKAGATQIVVTLTYSWSGTGSPPSASIAITGPGGTPNYQESSAVVYDRTSISVSGSTSTYSIIHRATFTIAAPGSAQTWTALISLTGVTSYNVAIEVS
jgi:hypothetical protein